MYILSEVLFEPFPGVPESVGRSPHSPGPGVVFLLFNSTRTGGLDAGDRLPISGWRDRSWMFGSGTKSEAQWHSRTVMLHLVTQQDEDACISSSWNPDDKGLSKL